MKNTTNLDNDNIFIKRDALDEPRLIVLLKLVMERLKFILTNNIQNAS